MSTPQDATAVAPQINGKDVAVHSVLTVGAAVHTGFSFLASVTKFGTARIVNAIDKTQTIQMSADYIDAKTDKALATINQKLSGYPPLPEVE